MSLKKPDDQKISNVPPFGLRMLPDLRAKVEEAAAQTGRSLNAEIIARLEHSFDSSRAFEPNKSIADRLALADHLADLARGLMLQEIEIAKVQGRDVDFDEAKKASDAAKKKRRALDLDSPEK